jgi:hypothetical protein
MASEAEAQLDRIQRLEHHELDDISRLPSTAPSVYRLTGDQEEQRLLEAPAKVHDGEPRYDPGSSTCSVPRTLTSKHQ